MRSLRIRLLQLFIKAIIIFDATKDTVEFTFALQRVIKKSKQSCKAAFLPFLELNSPTNYINILFTLSMVIV